MIWDPNQNIFLFVYQNLGITAKAEFIAHNQLPSVASYQLELLQPSWSGALGLRPSDNDKTAISFQVRMLCDLEMNLQVVFHEPTLLVLPVGRGH